MPRDPRAAGRGGCIRLRWLGLFNEELAELEATGWERAWHGCKLEALYSIHYHGGLRESRDQEGKGGHVT